LRYDASAHSRSPFFLAKEGKRDQFFFFFGRRKEKKGKKREKERARGKKRGTTLRPLRNALASRDFVAEFVARTKRKM
jgi:hypothetical protein